MPEGEPPLSCARPSGLRLSRRVPDEAGPHRGAGRDPADHAAAFEELYETWVDHVARWIRALGGPQGDREDLVQDVFLVAYRRLPDFDGRNPAGWLYRIARRRVRDFRRLRWFKYLVLGNGAVPPSGTVHTGASPVESLEQKRAGELLERLLEELNPEQRAAFVLFEIEGYAGQEIASLQGVPVNTVWARIHTARKKLKRRLEATSLDPAERLSREEHRT